jgi:uncharacterized protein YndB with AHSA1/START domain
MMTHLWLHEGSLDMDQGRLTLNSEGPNCISNGKLSQERDIIEFKSEDHRVLSLQRLEEDGQWRPFMTVDYRRESHTLETERLIGAPRERVFEAWTSPEILRQWSAPRGFTVTEASGEVRLGGEWSCRMRSPEGLELQLGGVYGEIVPPERLSFTHAWCGKDENPAPETRVTVRFDPCDGRTLLRFRQEGFRSRESRDGHAAGWNECLDQLADWLAKP